jgi:Protocatechuate 3,4-dioxygenase beta subunit
MRALAKMAIVVVWTVLVPTAAFAQGSITGTVKDTSGAVMPGVTVEASSPALIEKTRSAVTDGSGLYRIVDLRPGTYLVTFTLAGFNTIHRDGVVVSGSATLTIPSS